MVVKESQRGYVRPSPKSMVVCDREEQDGGEVYYDSLRINQSKSGVYGWVDGYQDGWLIRV